MFPKEHLLDFMHEEVGNNPLKRDLFHKIFNDIKETTGFSLIIRTRGDGNCLIRSIMNYYREHLPNIFMEVIVKICELANHDIIFWGEMDYDTFEEIVCIMVRKLVVEKWDYKGEVAYHMDENSIDGLAILMVMRLFGIGTLKIYQAYEDLIPDGKRPTGWRELKTTASFQEFDSITIPIFSMMGKHYHSIV